MGVLPTVLDWWHCGDHPRQRAFQSRSGDESHRSNEAHANALHAFAAAGIFETRSYVFAVLALLLPTVLNCVLCFAASVGLAAAGGDSRADEDHADSVAMWRGRLSPYGAALLQGLPELPTSESLLDI